MKYLTVVFMSMALVACTTKETPTVNIDYKPIPQELLQPVDTPMPIDEEEYVQLSWNEKEKVLHRSVLALYQAVNQANIQLKAIAQWNDTLLNTDTHNDKRPDKPNMNRRE